MEVKTIPKKSDLEVGDCVQIIKISDPFLGAVEKELALENREKIKFLNDQGLI